MLQAVDGTQMTTYIWYTFLHLEHWVAQMGFHHSRCEAGHLGCRLPASLRAHCGYKSSCPVKASYVLVWTQVIPSSHCCQSSQGWHKHVLLSSLSNIALSITLRQLAHACRSSRNRCLAPERLRIARQEFDHMLEHSPGDWRPCGDFGALNKVTVPDKHIPCTTSTGFYNYPTRSYNFLTCRPHTCMHITTYQSPQRMFLTAFHWWGTAWAWLCLCLHWWHIDCQLLRIYSTSDRCWRD